MVNLVCAILQSLLCCLHAGKDSSELSSELLTVSVGCGVGCAWSVIGVLFECEV